MTETRATTASATSIARLAFVRREARFIIAFIVVAVALLVVIRLGSEIRADGTSGFDR